MARSAPLVDSSPGKAFDCSIGAVTLRRGRAAYGVSDRAEILLSQLSDPDRIAQRIPMATPIRGFDALCHAPAADRFLALARERRGRGTVLMTFKLRPTGEGEFGSDRHTEVALDCLSSLPAEFSGAPIVGLAASEDATRVHLALGASSSTGHAKIATFEVARGEYSMRSASETIRSRLAGVRPVALPAGAQLEGIAAGVDGLWLAAQDSAGAHTVLWLADRGEAPAPAFESFGKGARFAGIAVDQGRMLVALRDGRAGRTRIVDIPLIVRR
jgi:hypothetical protein